MNDLFDSVKKYENWFEGFEQSTDPATRIEYLQEGLKAEPSEENKWRMEIMKRRYLDKKGNLTKADYFMAGWMDIKAVPRMAKQPFGKKHANKVLLEAAESLMLTEDKSDWEDWKKEILQKEYEHLIKFYVSLCQGDRMYTGLIMGFMSMKDDKVRDKLIKDIKSVVSDIPEFMNAGELLKPLKEAVDSLI